MVVIKFLSSFLVLLSASSLGFLYGNKYRKRASNLICLEQCFRILQSEIIFNLRPLPEALIIVSSKERDNLGEVFYLMSKDLVENKTGDVYDSFLSVKDILEEKYFLTKDDIGTFLSLGKVIGKTDKVDQEKNFNFILDQIRNSQREAYSEKSKYEKMYPTLGVLIGIGIIIIFI